MIPADVVLDIAAANFVIEHTDNGTHLALTGSPYHVVLASAAPHDLRALSFALGRLERQLQRLAGELRTS